MRDRGRTEEETRKREEEKGKNGGRTGEEKRKNGGRTGEERGKKRGRKEISR